MPVFLWILVSIVGFFGYRFWSRRSLRKRLLAQPLSSELRRIEDRQVPLSARLPENLRPGFEGKINLFLHQVTFHGCDGLEVTDEMRLSIAAQACLLIAGSDAWYRHLRTVLVYPGAFHSVQQERDGFVVSERRSIRSGESWQYGPVILSWQDSEQGALNDMDGRNVVLHEFAHQLDGLSGDTDGAPLMAKGQNFEDWRRVIVPAYQHHVSQVMAGRRTVIDEYGAEGPEEFFAVAIELFFERPDALKGEEPEVYQQISDLLGMDPSSWR
ncbi:zinc-dependent peptidase [Aliiroseovarius sp. KMU-50]|uniref:Zinc-dependent peptidase n=1 Tax=Aliiroseovarius salicola TaxID=3009082 RepID=A0ABT4W071_9RHOB|nr:M90 family metallopeptidase [Aliiroseovarius sp. KMU-50]MDA5093861.1 zinc-dependent peptidase [Aliiroseovarius sp. KMU-50]